MSCRLCGSTRWAGHHVAREMMYGTRATFGYFQCGDCLCLQIDEIPADLARHYEGGYYSYRPAERRRNLLKRWVGRARDRWAVLGGGAIGRRLYQRAPVVDWVQLDAPRHLYLFDHESIRRLAEATGFELEAIVHDSGAFQFWGSEQYRMDIALHDDRSYARNPDAGLFTAAQIAEFERRSVELNQAQRGDQAAFYLRKKR